MHTRMQSYRLAENQGVLASYGLTSIIDWTFDSKSLRLGDVPITSKVLNVRNSSFGTGAVLVVTGVAFILFERMELSKICPFGGETPDVAAFQW